MDRDATYKQICNDDDNIDGNDEHYVIIIMAMVIWWHLYLTGNEKAVPSSPILVHPAFPAIISPATVVVSQERKFLGAHFELRVVEAAAVLLHLHGLV